MPVNATRDPPAIVRPSEVGASGWRRSIAGLRLLVHSCTPDRRPDSVGMRRCRVGPPRNVPSRRSRSAGPMPVVPMREILDPAFADRYGVAAINVVDDLSPRGRARGRDGARRAADRPDVAEDRQVDGRPAVHGDLAGPGRGRAGPGHAAPRPLPGPRVDLDLPARGLELGPVRRLGARRRREHTADDRGRRRGRLLRRAGGGRDRERRRGRGRHRLRGGGEVHPVEVSGEFIEDDRDLLVRARDRHGPRALQGRAEAHARAGHRARRAAPDPAWSCTAAPA